MNRQQAINYLKSSGFSDEQIREIEEGLRPKRIQCSGVNDLRDKILIKSLDPDIRWMRQAIDQLITDVFSAACNEDFLYEEKMPEKVYGYFFERINDNIDLIEDDLHKFRRGTACNKYEDIDEMIAYHTHNLNKYLKQIDVIIRSALEDIDEKR